MEAACGPRRREYSRVIDHAPRCAGIAEVSGRIDADPDAMEVAAGSEHENLQGWVAQLATENDTRDALEKAFDYRGDVTLIRKDGTTIEGYVFDRHSGASLADSFVRIIPVGQRARLSIPYADIGTLKFTGKDTAAGKSFESWIKKYWAKKAAGETNIQIEPENLD
jgi:hypothetical protein